ncbi:hypothetical protein [Stenotrophomonas sp. VV52]|uniref:hypothetical protein n=1 Tax=Stenotrophomonas sp. VV52 TaxID=2066958 RepID=UPI000C9E4A87|nr:hypothetical protein [Stenotrophomonas sp. VV52]
MADLMSILQANAAPPQGWTSVGQALAGLGGAGSQNAYDRGMAKAAQLDQLVQTARYSREKAMEAERQRNQQTGLAAALESSGWSPNDARVAGAFAGSGLNPNEYAAARLAGQEFGNRDSIVASALGGNLPEAGAYSMGLAKGPIELTKIVDGTGYNPYLEADQQYHTTPVGQSTIGQRNAAAAASYASAANSNASAARTRQATVLDRADTAGGRGGMKAPSGYRWNNGNLEFIPGGPADPAMKSSGAPSEGERKSATLLARLEGSLGQMNSAIADDETAAKPGILAALAGNIPFSGETARNLANSSERQRVEAAQLDILDAALTLGTGAAYTKEQLEGYRKSFFPQLGDSSDTVKDKQDRLNTVVNSARIAAGRAAPAAAAVAPTSAAEAFGGPPASPLQRARNPNTGQVVVLRNGQWVPE